MNAAIHLPTPAERGGHMAGSVAVVTGASAGIGRATALAFARAGTRVVVADVQREAGEETARLIREGGGEAVFVHTDDSLDAEAEAWVRSALETFGRLDFAFNNAGIEGQSAPAAECTRENWDRVLAINLTGVWLCMRHEIRQMLLQGGGSIVNCSSVAGLVGFAGIAAYTASKHGMVGLTRAAALDYAQQGIRVNAVCPGVIRTAMVERFTHGDPQAEAALVAREPMGRMGTPDEIAAAVLWLCSDAASFVTGQALAVDGGFVSQ
jgi:NAD(P)-dependent dehydrogenase (short-subunit alcohol dehydrogenase family)